MPKTKFLHYPNRPQKLTQEFAKSEYNKLLERISAAENSKSPSKWLRLFKDWDVLSSYIHSEGGRLIHKHNVNTSIKKDSEAEKYYREKVWPVTIEPGYLLTKSLVESKHRSALAKVYGSHLLIIAENSLRPLDPVNTKLRIKESNLSQRYNKILSSAKIKLGNKTLTIEKAGSYLISPNESTRKQAFIALRKWYLGNRPALRKIYSEQIKLRNQMGKNLGYKTYVPLAYELMGRIDYGEAEVKKFRSLIKQYFTPLDREISKGQAKILGKKVLRPWDAYDPRTTLPIGIVPPKKQLQQAQKLFDRLSPQVGSLVAKMVAAGHIDLENRRNKSVGGYCMMFSDTGDSVIFCNSTGNDNDIRTITHEVGHSFQWSKSSAIKTTFLQMGSADLAEINSLAMEFLCLPYIDVFFSPDNAKKFSFARWDRAVGLLCSCCVGDEFQEWVYTHPGSSPSTIENKWGELSNKYLSADDYSGYHEYKNIGWYGIHHFFEQPFYYIDYALAETVAMQIAMIDAQDHQKAMKIYMELCRLGGTKGFLASLRHVGLQSPFDEELIKNLANYAAKKLASA